MMPRSQALVFAAWVMMLGAVSLAGDSGGTGTGDPASGGTFDGGTATSPVLLPDGTAGAPGLSWASDPTTGVYLSVGKMTHSAGGAARYQLATQYWQSTASGGPAMRSVDSTATTPNILSDKLDTDTGRGASAADCFTDIAGGVTAIDSCESAGNITTTMSGTLVFDGYTRHIELQVGTAMVGSTAPTKTIVGTYAGRGFDADAEEMHVSFEAPSDWNGTSDMTMRVAWSNASGTAVADGETVIWLAELRADAVGDDIDAGSVYSTSGTHTQSGGGTDGEMYSTDITIDFDNANQPIAAGDVVGVKFSRDVTNDTYGAVHATVLLWEIEYTSTALSTH